jgi:hypothetical protein
MKLKYLLMLIFIYLIISTLIVITGYAGIENYNKNRQVMENYYREK